jgi:hypothetical protein
MILGAQQEAGAPERPGGRIDRSGYSMEVDSRAVGWCATRYGDHRHDGARLSNGKR